MASEDMKTGESAVSTIMNLAKQAKFAREGVKAPSYAILKILQVSRHGGVAGRVSLFLFLRNFDFICIVWCSVWLLRKFRSCPAVAPLERLKILLQVKI
ncbi:Mitochondrial adenine nucleotide transporter ADNT1 [Camellia lanceoleosa]|uniref:Mitochondrial adenine nucleotide transporter ADNT1 n=1 Tax=Camellia lanceoleosa TaxID=1840588 RepID=A0ACC0IK25_9ERIC|nr:Mitochondrial adenine nucleotide transporter ADNT1 [Camellia lanceoleosa]